MITRKLAAFFVGALVAGSAQAALHDRGGGLIYDDDLNVTWFQDANYAQTSGYDLDGVMTWNDAMAWATSLVYYNNATGQDISGWRLPTTLLSDPSCDPAFGSTGASFGCSGSEMGHLFYNELGGVTGQDINTTHNANYYLFKNIQSHDYWSSTVATDTNTGWIFYFSHGLQTPGNALSAWAVRDGDVAAASVPEPETYAMFLAGLGLVGFMASRRNAA